MLNSNLAYFLNLFPFLPFYVTMLNTAFLKFLGIQSQLKTLLPTTLRKSKHSEENFHSHSSNSIYTSTRDLRSHITDGHLLGFSLRATIPLYLHYILFLFVDSKALLSNPPFLPPPSLASFSLFT